MDRPTESNATRTGFLADSLDTLVTRFVIYLLLFGINWSIARFFGPAVKGQVALTMAVTLLLSSLFSLGLPVAVTYWTGQRSKKGLTDASPVLCHPNRYAYVVMVIATAVVIGYFMFGQPQWTIGSVDAGLLIWGVVAFPFLLAIDQIIAALNGSGHLRIGNRVSVLQSVLYALVIIVVFVLGTDNITSRSKFIMGGFAVAMSVVWFYGKSRLRQVSKNSEGDDSHRDTVPIGPMLQFGLRGYVGNVVRYLNYRLDIFLLNQFVVASSLGVYSVAANVSEALWFVPSVVAYALFPATSRAEKRESYARSNRVLRVLLWSMLPIAVLLGVVIPMVIEPIFGGAYNEAVTPILILLPGSVALSLGRICASQLAGSGRPGLSSIGSLAGLIVTLIGAIWLIPRYGIVGAAIASSVAYGAITVMLWVFYQRFSPFPWTDAIALRLADWSYLWQRARSLLASP